MILTVDKLSISFFADGTNVDFLKRLKWALELAQISANQYLNVTRIPYMNTELNNTVKFFISSDEYDTRIFKRLKTVPIAHFKSIKKSGRKYHL